MSIGLWRNRIEFSKKRPTDLPVQCRLISDPFEIEFAEEAAEWLELRKWAAQPRRRDDRMERGDGGEIMAKRVRSSDFSAVRSVRLRAQRCGRVRTHPTVRRAGLRAESSLTKRRFDSKSERFLIRVQKSDIKRQ